MVAFSQDELDPELLPVLEYRIRQAQAAELTRSGGRLPEVTNTLERSFDNLNQQHREFIRAGFEEPPLRSAGLVEKFVGNVNLWTSLSLWVQPVILIIANRQFDGWLINPWVFALIQLVAMLLVLKPLITRSKLRARELPWIQTSLLKIDDLGFALRDSGFAVWFAVASAAWTIFYLLGIYSADHIEDVMVMVNLIIASAVPICYAACSATMVATVKADFKHARHALAQSELQAVPLPMAIPAALGLAAGHHDKYCEKLTARITPESLQALQTATFQVADELVSAGTLTPELGSRLIDAPWWQSRILYTTPAFAAEKPLTTRERFARARQSGVR